MTSGDVVLATFDPDRTYTIHWTDDLITNQHQIVGARTDNNGRPWVLLTRNPTTGAESILNWDKIAAIEEGPLIDLHAQDMFGG